MENGKKKGLQLAIDHFGGVSGLAEALGIKRQAIYMWAGQIPRARVYQLESITEGELKAEDLFSQPRRAKQREARA